ncbi:MAG TPA: hypothetical protein VEM35_03940, partial [Rhizomicrobium sp.]|nr:hypothetical protein [Rhizomicrobium sp.]
SEWDSDERLWTHGSRACDCTRALLFAQELEIAACPCGMSGYAIRAISADGVELYCEDDFDEADELFDDAVEDAGMVAAPGIGAYARQTFNRLAMQVAHYAADMQTGGHHHR